MFFVRVDLAKMKSTHYQSIRRLLISRNTVVVTRFEISENLHVLKFFSGQQSVTLMIWYTWRFGLVMATKPLVLVGELECKLFTCDAEILCGSY